MKINDFNINNEKVMIFLHPMLASSEAMIKHITSRIGDGYRYIIPDLSAHGEESKKTYISSMDEAETLYKDSEVLFGKYKENAFYKKHFTILDLFMDLCCYGKKEGVAERIQEARRMYPEKQLQEDFEYLEGILDEGKENLQEDTKSDI